jgi:hypothetical protein
VDANDKRPASCGTCGPSGGLFGIDQEVVTDLATIYPRATTQSVIPGLRFRGLGGRDASLPPAHEYLHGVLAFARLVGVFVGVR